MKRNWHLLRILLAGESTAAYSVAEIEYHIALLGPGTGQADAATFDCELKPTLTERGRSLLADLGTAEYLTAILAECEAHQWPTTSQTLRIVSQRLRNQEAKAAKAAPASDS